MQSSHTSLANIYIPNSARSFKLWSLSEFSGRSINIFCLKAPAANGLLYHQNNAKLSHFSMKFIFLILPKFPESHFDIKEWFKYWYIYLSLQIIRNSKVLQLSTIMARSIITWFCVWNGSDWGKMYIRGYIHKRLPGKLWGIFVGI